MKYTIIHKAGDATTTEIYEFETLEDFIAWEDYKFTVISEQMEDRLDLNDMIKLKLKDEPTH